MDYRSILRVLKGDVLGHEFHGNQWSGRKQGFVSLKTTKIDHVIESNSFWGDKGSQNRGIAVVQLKGGSKAVVKTCSEADANAEVLAAQVGKVLGSPIRDAQLVPGSVTEVMSPLIEGETVVEKGQSYADTPIDPRINFLDDVIGNWDRNPGNIIISPDGKQQIGIDQSSAFGVNEMDSRIPDFTEMGNPTKDQIMSWTDGLQALQPNFQSSGYGESFQKMMDNWKMGATNYMATNGML